MTKIVSVLQITAMLLWASDRRLDAQGLAPDVTPGRFELASIRATTRAQIPAPQVLPSGQFEMAGATLRDLIRLAYPTSQGQVDVVGGPDWVRSGRFDVIGKPPAGMKPTVAMLQSLLAERFNLKVRSETREGTVWRLTLASRQGTLGPGLSASTCGTGAPCAVLRIGAGPTLTGEASLDDLASILSNSPVINAPVANRTGLTGLYSIRLRWRADNNPNPDAGPLIFTALEEQLGLKLERGTGTVPVVVVEAVKTLIAD